MIGGDVSFYNVTSLTFTAQQCYMVGNDDFETFVTKCSWSNKHNAWHDGYKHNG